MKILFSPIGNTDPISDSNFYDGAMLHICRHYDIDKVYMYMSEQIFEKEKADHRFTKIIDKLSEKKGGNKKIEWEILHSHIQNVYEFDKFIPEFRKNIKQIMEENPDAQLYLNASSGTPGMKSAIVVLGTFGEYENTIIQVTDPNEGMSTSSNTRGVKAIDVDQMWNDCKDNNAETSKGKRSKKVDRDSLFNIKQREALKGLIHAYDYDAAWAVAKMIGDHTLTKMLELAYYRSLLDLKRVEQIENVIGQSFTLLQDEKYKKVFEYALSLEIKLKRSEYVEFVRGISPIIVELFWLILKSSCNLGIRIEDYRGKKHKWNKKKMVKGDPIFNALNSGYKNAFKPGDIKANDLKILILEFSEDEHLKKIVEELRKVEGSVRNLAAHEMVSLNEDEIKKRTGMSTEDIVRNIRELFGYSGIAIQDDDWKSYDHMNKRIIDQMNSEQQ